MCVCVFVCLNVFFLCPWLFLSWKKGRRSRTSVFSPEYKLTRLVSQIGWPSYYHFSQKGNQPQFRKLQCTITLIFEETRNVALKIGAMIRSVKFVSPEVALFCYISAIRPCMDCYCQVLGGASSWYLELLDKLQKMDLEDCRSFTYHLPWTLGSSSKCSQLTSFL